MLFHVSHNCIDYNYHQPTVPDTNEFHIEYLRFEKDTPLPEELQTLVHVAYKVDDLDKQLAENKVIVEPWMADEHTRIAFIMKDGILFELMEEVK